MNCTEMEQIMPNMWQLVLLLLVAEGVAVGLPATLVAAVLEGRRGQPVAGGHVREAVVGPDHLGAV